MRGRRGRPDVRLARVVRVESPEEEKPNRAGGAAGAVEGPLVIELGGARVAVRPGFDRATLAAILEVVATQAGAR